jgi:hypothetical protein
VDEWTVDPEPFACLEFETPEGLFVKFVRSSEVLEPEVILDCISRKKNDHRSLSYSKILPSQVWRHFMLERGKILKPRAPKLL